MKKLPVGIQTFRKIIEGGYLYADKTQYIYNLLQSSECCFLSRPRRFGKSLLLDTIGEVFGGERELFRGLWIYNSDYEFKKHPVIRLDMAAMETKNEGTLNESILDRLREYIADEGLSVNTKLPSSVFQSVIRETRKKYGERVVVLIDEYDKPVLDHITDPVQADANRRVIKGFFGVLKGLDAHLKFTFFTGVSKFTKTSLFSELNNLWDITLVRDYANICGFTEQDFSALFAEHIQDILESGEFSGMTEEALRNAIYRWYDGYSWDGKTHVLNPFSLLNFFKGKAFSSYWFSSGSPSFLINLIKKTPQVYTDLNGAVMDETALDATDILRVSPISLMFQTGYLTISKVERYLDAMATYYLRTPNREVREAFDRHIVAEFAGTDAGTAQAARFVMVSALEAGEPEKLEASLSGLFASIPYELHVDREAYYHSLLYAVMQLLGFNIEAEVSVSGGRVDGILELPNAVYVMEVKYRRHEGEGVLEDALKECFAQIEARGYCARYAGSGKTVYKTAVAVAGRGEVRVKHEEVQA